MKTMTRTSTLLALTLVLGAATEAHAQRIPGADDSPGWSVTVFGSGGAFYSTRDLGKSRIDQPGAGGLAQMRSEYALTPVAALGLEIQSPFPELRIRVRGRTTVGGAIRGQLGGCRVLTGAEAGEACVEVETDAALRSFTAGLMFIRAPTPGQNFRPYLTLDAGIRSFSFDDESCTADGDAGWVAALCSGQTEITEDQTRSLLEAGLGVRVRMGRVDVHLHVADAFGGYEVEQSESGTAEGETQNALVFSAGLSVPIG